MPLPLALKYGVAVITPSPLTQEVLAKMIGGGDLDQHVRKMVGMDASDYPGNVG